MNTPQQQVAEAAASTLGGKITFGMTQGGAALSVIGGLTLNEWAAAVGMVVAVAGLVGNFIITNYWKRKHYRLERERLEWDQRRHERRQHERRGEEFSEMPADE